MPKLFKIVLFSAGGLVGLLLFVAVAALFFMDANVYKPRLEAAASGALGMEVKVDGRLGIDIFPNMFITLEDVNIRNRGTDLASADEVNLAIDLLALLQKEIRIGKIVLKRPRISIERNSDGKFNFEKTEEAREESAGLDLAKISLADGTLLFTDKQSGEGFEAVNCSLSARNLQLTEAKRSDLLKRLSVTADITCGEIRTKNFVMSDVKFSVAGKNGAFDFKPVTLRIFSGQGSGDIRADFSGDINFYQIHYSLSQFRIEEFFRPLMSKKIAEGPMDFSANLSMKGKTVNEMKRSAEGEVSLVGKNLTLNGSDLDREFARFESSQSFSLVDAGAFFFVGPLGLAVTKGYNFAGIFRGSGGNSKIQTLVSHWKIDHGVAQAQDVAMATNENRMALTGKLDLVNEQIDDVTMALIDARGCAKVRQKIHGSFQKPVVVNQSVLKSLAGPALKLLKKGRGLFPGGECEVFYAGSAPSPK